MSKATDQAYDIIRRAILDGTFAPGDRLKEEHLVDLCGVSRTPIREAIQRLAAKNYLVSKPNFGSHVANWSDKEIADIFTLRAIVEGMAAKRATENITDEQIAALQKEHDCIADVLAEPGELDIQTFLEANTRFHDVILSATKSEPLALTANRLVSPPIVAHTAHNYSREDLSRSNAHHKELISAMKVKDADWAEATMQSHIRAAHHRFLEASNGV